MSEFNPLEYTQEVMELIEEMSFITPEEEFVEDILSEADDQKPYCMADQSNGAIDFEGKYISLTEAAFLRASYKLYLDFGIEYLAEAYTSSSEAEDLETLLDEADSDLFSFWYYLDYCMRWDAGFYFIVKDQFTAGNERDKEDVEKNIKQFGVVDNVDYNLERLEVELS